MSFGFEKFFGSGEKRMPPPSDKEIAENRKHIDEMIDGVTAVSKEPIFDGPDPRKKSDGDASHITRH